MFQDITGWGENDRGVSFTFGADVVRQFLRRQECSLIVRAHQVVEDGYQFFGKRKVRLSSKDYFVLFCINIAGLYDLVTVIKGGIKAIS